MTPREILIENQNWHKKQILGFEEQIRGHKIQIDILEKTIDLLDEAETEAFNKDRG